MPIAHTTLLVSDLAAAKTFYTTAIAPLGYKPMMEFPGTVGFGTAAGKVDFWLKDTRGVQVPTVHIAFLGESEDAVKGFYEQGVKAGGKGNGEPGLRAHYGEGYFASFVLDLEGNNMEVVYFKGK